MKILTCLLLLLSPVCFAQNLTYNQGGTDAKKYYEEIPYQDINGKLIIEVEVAGKKHKFLIDTGAPCAISPELANEIKAKPIFKAGLHDAYMHTDSSLVVELNDLKLGNGLVFNHIPAITLFPSFYRCFGIDGVIGANLLRKSIVSFVGNRHIVVFTDQKNKLNLKSKFSTDLISNTGPQSDPQIKIVLNNKLNLTIPFDTGDSDFIRINDDMVTQLQQYNGFTVAAQGYGQSATSALGLQAAAHKYLYKVAPIKIGATQFNNLIVESNKAALPAMGSKMINYGTVTLDYINSKFYFECDQVAVDLAEKHWPVKPAFQDDKLLVGVVFEKAKEHIKQGEQILAINGKDFSHIDVCNLIISKPVLDGSTTAVLTLKDSQGNIHKETIIKE